MVAWTMLTIPAIDAITKSAKSPQIIFDLPSASFFVSSDSKKTCVMPQKKTNKHAATAIGIVRPTSLVKNSMSDVSVHVPPPLPYDLLNVAAIWSNIPIVDQR